MVRGDALTCRDVTWVIPPGHRFFPVVGRPAGRCGPFLASWAHNGPVAIACEERRVGALGSLG
jgi:hypothetical protein